MGQMHSLAISIVYVVFNKEIIFNSFHSDA